MSGPLDGIRVLDLTSGMTGAFATMFLADYGAEVVKVTRPGDPARQERVCRTWERGKSSIVADLTDPADREVVRSLAAGADIVVEGLRPGLLDGLGLGAAAISAANPRVVHCTITAFDGGPGADDPAGYAALAAARYGVMAESGGHREGPIFPGHPALEYGTAFVAVIGILAALRARIVTGEGDRLRVSMADGVLAQMGMNWWNERNLSFIAKKSRTGALDMGHLRMLLRRFVCSDGRMVQVHTGAAGAFGRAMELFGLADEVSRVEPGLETAALLTDQDLTILHERLPAIFAAKTSDEWLRLCWEHEVACLPVQPPGLVFDDDQIRHAGIMRELDDPELGPIEVVGPVIKFSRSPGEVQGPPPRRPDADGDRLRSSGWASPGLAVPAAPRPLDHPLDGIRIVELSIWFASPYGNRMLSDLGADVVKVESLVGDTIRPLPDPCEGANRGKRSLSIDLKSAEGSEVVQRLLATADVVQHNMRPGAAERLGIDEATLRPRFPNLVYAYAPGYGSTGPKSRLQSFAPLLSGFVGLMTLSAGEGNAPHTGFGNEDYYNGLLSATSILLALVHRERTGEAQYVESPQLHSSVLVTSEWFASGGVLQSSLPSLDGEQTGWGTFYRLYQCLDGWICVACLRDDQITALLGALLPDEPVTFEPSEDLSERLSYEFFGRTAEDWVTLLRSVGVPCEVVREESWLRSVLLDDDAVAQGRVNEIEHPLHGRARVIGQLFRLEDHPGVRRGRSPLLGEQSDELLTELGFDPAERDALFAAGIVVARLPEPAAPAP